MGRFTYGLPESFSYIMENYPIKPRRVEPYKLIYRVEAEEGFFALKEIKYPEDEFAYIYAAMEHLIAYGFNRINRMIPAKNYYPFAEYRGKRYFLSKWIAGREADYNRKEDLGIAAHTLAQLHQASKGFDPPPFEGRVKWGTWPANMERKTRELLELKEQVQSKNRKRFFDRVFLNHVDYYVKESRKAFDLLIKEGYEKVNRRDANGRYFCHHDYAHHNVIIDQEGRGSVIDFDYCLSDIRCHDLASLMLRVLKKSRWNYRNAYETLKVYDRARTVRSSEIGVISAILRFPQDFWQVAFAYYVEQNQPRERLERKIKNWVLERKIREKSLHKLDKLM